MTAALQHLITEARAAADPKPAWVDEGGRATVAASRCSAFTDHYDYGQRGGPGWRWCRDNCRHGYREQFE